MSKNLVDKLHVWGFEDGKLIFKDFSLASIYQIEAKDISCKTDEFLNSFKSQECHFLNSLPEGLSVQFVQMTTGGVDSIIESHQSQLVDGADEITKELLSERVKKLRQQDQKNEIISVKRLLVIRRKFISQPKKNVPLWKRIKDFFFRNQIPDEEVFSRSILEPELKSFSLLEDDMQKKLESLGIKSKRLSEDQVFKILFDQWNPGHLIGPGSYDAEDFRNHLILSDFAVNRKGFTINGVNHRVISLKMMPEKTFSTMAEKLKNLPFGSSLYLTINVLDQIKEDFALKTQRQIAYAMYSGKKGVQDLESAAKLQDLEAILAKRVSGETKIFSVGLNVVLRHSDVDELDAQCAEVLTKLREIAGAEGILESIAASYIFFDISLPNARCSERNRPMNTEVLADFLPIYGEWLGHMKPRVLLKSQSNGLIGFDPFSSTHTNYNQLISGSSGAGKSYFGNILISNLMKESPQVFIIDVGGSYKKTTENFNGQYIPIGADSLISINPFDLSSTDTEAKDQKIKFLTSLVELMTKEEDEKGIRKLQRAEIEMMIKSILQFVPDPRLSDLKNKLLENSDESIQKMGKILEPWCGDTPYGKFIDQKTNLNLDKKIVCFDLKGLENLPDLQAVCLFLITDLIWREVQKDKINQKFVIFDESWTLLDNDAGAKLIESVFRTFRKYMASAIAISQSIEDFADSKIAKAIFSCSSVKWILRQNTSRRELVQKVLSLNDREMDLIDSVTSKKGYFSEAFLISGDDKQVVKIESTPLEYWLSTTDPIDMKKMDELKSEFSDNLSLFKHLAEKYPHGAS